MSEAKLFKKVDNSYIEITKDQLLIELQEANKSLEKEIERLNNIINELEKWLEEKQMITGINNQGFSWGVAGDCLDKLKELKGDKK